MMFSYYREKLLFITSGSLRVKTIYEDSIIQSMPEMCLHLYINAFHLFSSYQLHYVPELCGDLNASNW